MDDKKRMQHLRAALVLLGLFCIFGIYTMMTVWPGGWTWEPRHHEYEQMLLGVYATMGVFLLIASRDPMSHTLFIWFVVFSSAVHGGIMAVQALADKTERANLLGDVSALFTMAAVLAYLMLKVKTKDKGR